MTNTVTIKLKKYFTPDNEPTCKTREGQCFFLGGNMKGERICMYANYFLTPRNSQLFRYENHVNGFLEPHPDCLLKKDNITL